LPVVPDVLRHGKHAKGIGFAQILLHRKGELGDIGQGFQIFWVDIVLDETLAIKRRVFKCMAQRTLHPVKLQGRNLIPRGYLYRVQIFLVRG
jgi:hypothetical protein